MKEAELEKLKGLFMLGEDIEYQDIVIRNYELGEIFKDLKLDKYNYLLSFAVLDVKDIFKDSKINIDKLKKYDVICDIPEFNNWFIEFLNTFTYLKWEFGKFRDFVTYSDGKRIRITEDKFDGFMELFKKMYCVNRSKTEEKYDLSWATSDKAREMMEEFAEDERKQNASKSKITLNGIINGICSESNGYTLLNIWNLTMYQLMSQYYSIEQNKNYGFVMSSIYNGVYDTTKNKLNIEDIHWACEIKI